MKIQYKIYRLTYGDHFSQSNQLYINTIKSNIFFILMAKYPISGGISLIQKKCTVIFFYSLI